MVVEAQRTPLDTLAAAAAKAANAVDVREALAAVADAVAEAAEADLAVVRVVDAAGDLVARAVAPAGSALAAEVAGSRSRDSTRQAAERARAAGSLAAVALAGAREVGCVELVRIASPFGESDRAAAELAAAQVALTLRAFGAGSPPDLSLSRRLELVGQSLVTSADADRAWASAARVAADAAGADAGLLWRFTPSRELDLAGTGVVAGVPDRTGGARARELAEQALAAWQPVTPVADRELGTVVTLPLGEPTIGALQLLYAHGFAPGDEHLAALTAFAPRVAHALRASERVVELALELDRTSALVEVVGEAISRLSLAHTLETAVERIAELLRLDEVGLYLRGPAGLEPAAGRRLVAGHDLVARELLALVLGPLRARSAVVAQAQGGDPTFAAVRAALAAVGRANAVAVPLHVREESIGLLVAFPTRALSDGEQALLASLGAQLAVAVQNARLHEQATGLGDALGEALASERQASRQLRALYEISRSFAQSLSLETTLAAVTSTIVDVLDVDAAVMRVPDERGDVFVPRAVHVADSRLAEAVQTILSRPQPRPPRTTAPTMLDAPKAARLGGGHALLVPFLEKGSTAALLPIANATELLGELTLLSLDPAAPIDDEVLTAAGTIAQQAALAIDNARLYSQQKAFAETMQRSLLPRERPDLHGLEVGAVYESAAQVDVGGDVFDFLDLPDGRLAVVLGDVTGHGIDATADMAMAKFVFRSLAREHPEPSAFLEHANEVVVGEIAVGKFITMVYVAVAPNGELLCAGAGHPAPRLVRADGRVEELPCAGLALGIDAPQRYEQLRAELQPGDAVVLYTDGVIEARHGRELYGSERLDAVLAEQHAEPAQGIADAVVAACRAFAGGALGDDCAIVVLKRTHG